MPSIDEIMKALTTVEDPELHKDLVSLKMVDQVRVEGDLLRLKVILTTPACPLKGEIKDRILRAVTPLGIRELDVEWGANVPTSMQGPFMGGIKNAIAVGSGKGGVGKSTVAVNLALALAETGAKVGLLDADIYGPSIPMMMGISTKPVVKDGKMVPVEAYGIKLMSIGFLLPNPDDPVIWRGPMLGGVLNQFLREVEWGEIDYLLIDLPPGTGDVPLSLAQSVPLAGAAIVITPQPVAQQIGLKTLKMFKQVNVPILGIIENMSAFVCPHCDGKTEIFHHGGGEKTSLYAGVPLLGEIPLDPKIRIGGDEGKPVFVADPASPHAEAFRRIAGALAARVSTQYATRVELPVLQ